MNKLTCTFLLLCISIPIHASEDYKTNAILNTCLWKADIAQGAQLARQEYPGRTPEEHTQKIVYLLQQENFEHWYIQTVLNVFKQVFETKSIHTSSTVVFVEIHNDCVKKTKESIDKGQFYPEIPQEVTEEYIF